MGNRVDVQADIFSAGGECLSLSLCPCLPVPSPHQLLTSSVFCGSGHVGDSYSRCASRFCADVGVLACLLLTP